ncbi:MAG: GMC family oxidoreductase [Pseudomonadota bacterium]
MALIDARDAPDGSEIEADIVIIGGGVAGAVLGRELAGSTLRVAILEGGGRTADPASQELYKGAGVLTSPDGSERRIDAFLTDSRARMLGGTGNIWGGRCIPLTPADFRRNPWTPNSGWPLSRRTLDPFYARACDHLSVPRFAAGSAGLPTYEVSSDFWSQPGYWSPCTGNRDRGLFDTFRAGHAEAVNIDIWINANVREIVLDAASDTIDHLEIACLNGRRHTARARAYVLATGGIENARLLLASNRVRSEGLANRQGLVGRYFQGHVAYIARAKADETTSMLMTAGGDLTPYDFPTDRRAHLTLATTEKGRKRLRTGGFDVNIYRRYKIDPTPAASAVTDMARRLDGGAGDPVHHVIGVQAEQPPVPESRVVLGRDADALGMPRVELQWRLPASHWDTLERSVDALGHGLGASGRGRLCWPFERARYSEISVLARHHIGTTRMSRDPEHGVVDADCRAHDVANLYVAGSSVFPTSGIANPTLTLVALAIRLADHLKRDRRVRR